MKTYYLRVLVRPNDSPGPERMLKRKVRASCEIDARREVLETIWLQDLLVSDFLTVKRRRRK